MYYSLTQQSNYFSHKFLCSLPFEPEQSQLNLCRKLNIVSTRCIIYPERNALFPSAWEAHTAGFSAILTVLEIVPFIFFWATHCPKTMRLKTTILRAYDM